MVLVGLGESVEVTANVEHAISVAIKDGNRAAADRPDSAADGQSAAGAVAGGASVDADGTAVASGERERRTALETTQRTSIKVSSRCQFGELGALSFGHDSRRTRPRNVSKSSASNHKV